MALATNPGIGQVEESPRGLLGFSGRAYRVAVRALGSREGAEDVVQQAFLEAMERLRAGVRPDDEQAWFLGVVANAARKHARSEARLRRRENAAMRNAEGPRPGPDPELVALVAGSLEALDVKYRLPLALCCEEGLTKRQAAAILEMPESTVSKYVEVGLERLRESLRRSGYAAAPAAVIGALAHTAPAVPPMLTASIAKLAAGAGVASEGAVALPVAAKGGLLVKIGMGVATAGLMVGGAFWAVGGQAQDKPAPAPAPASTPNLDNLPIVIPDESAQDWVVDRFAGNSTTGPIFYQGPAREVGGLGGAGVTELPDGTIYVGCAAGLTEFAPDGVLRLFMSADGPIEGPLEQCQAGRLIWNAKEKALYLTGPRCIRKVVEKPDGTKWVEVFAGVPNEEPGKGGPKNGPVKTATFPLSSRGIVCNSQGVFYALDVWHGLRKIENGEVVNVGLKFVDGPNRFDLSLSGNLALGEDDDTLYVADHWNWLARRIDLKTGEVRNVAFMARQGGTMPNVRRERLGQNADGPALTHASHNSGLGGVSYDRFHKALWVNGDDETRFRWLKDGWVKSVIGCDNKARGSASTGRWSFEEMGTPGPKASIAWCSVRGFDSKGGVYIGGGGLPHGVWRAYNKKEGSSHESWSKKEDKP